MAKRKSSPGVPRAKPSGRSPHRPPAEIPAEFVTPSQALEYLTGPEGSSLRPHATSRRGETPWELAQARLIRAHIAGRVNLVGRKGDVNDLDAVSDVFERIPNEIFAPDIILGDTIVALPTRRGKPASGEFWRDVKMPRKEFEAAFKPSSAEDALLEWWKAKTKQDGKPPTEYDAYLQFAQQQQPRLPRRWLTEELKKLPRSVRRKGSGRPPDAARKPRPVSNAEAKRKARAASIAAAKAANANLKPARSSGSKVAIPTKTRTRPKRISKDGPTRGLHADYRHIIRQETTEKTAACWKVNIKRRTRYMHKYFPDVKYGGKEKALEAAQAYLESLMSSISNPDYMLWRRNKKTEANTSGIVGVGRYVVKFRKGKRIQWQAAWQDVEGKQHCKIFLVSTHGERQARALAIAARRDAMAELHEELTRRGAIYE
ncbi:MAG TPA: AP2 domain-containing protein [Rhizomicrobium sp.]|jgi:hypothetical protein|nr:AP2 domain-containing protein [Rhizomicrobium sp.]